MVIPEKICSKKQSLNFKVHVTLLDSSYVKSVILSYQWQRGCKSQKLWMLLRSQDSAMTDLALPAVYLMEYAECVILTRWFVCVVLGCADV